METKNRAELLEELVLLVIYLSSWSEKNKIGPDIQRAWKGYDFSILDQLKEKGFVDFSFGAKSLSFTEEGKKQAELLLTKYGNS